MRPLLPLILCISLLGQQPSAASLSTLLERYRSEPANAKLCQQIALAYTQLNDFPQAADFFRKTLALDPQSIPADKNLATVLWFGGQKAESLARFRALERKIPADPVPQLYLGLSAYETRDMASAAAHFEHAGALASENPEVLPAVITSFLAAGRRQQAVTMLEKRVEAGDPDPQLYRLLGDAYDRLNLPSKAEAAYSKAIAEAPRIEDSYLTLAGFSIEHNNPSAAQAVLDRGLTELPGSAKLTLEKGLLQAIGGDFAGASKLFKDANSLDARWSVPLLALGITDLQTGNVAGAEDNFRKAKQIAPNDFRCYYFHALALNRSQSSQNAKTRSQAMEDLRHAIALDPDRTQPRITLAQMQSAAGLTVAAEAELREVIRLDPQQSSAIYKLALLCRREGKTEEADRLLAAFAALKKDTEVQENNFALLSETMR